MPIVIAAAAWPGEPFDMKAAPGWKIRLPYLTPWGLKLAAWGNKECLWSFPTEEKVVALTFDDGPSLTAMPELLAALKHHEIPATFFFLGDRMEHAEKLLQEAVRDGHEIAFHGMRHRSLRSIPPATLKSEVDRMREMMDKILGQGAGSLVRFFRPPFGQTTAATLRTLREEKLLPVNASILPGDVYFPNGWSEEPERTAHRIVRKLHPGAIICLHAGDDLGRKDHVYSMSDPAWIVHLLAPALKERGYRVALLRDLIPAAK